MKRLWLFLCLVTFGAIAAGCNGPPNKASDTPGQGGGGAGSAEYVPLEVERRLASKGCRFFLTARAARLLKEADPADLLALLSGPKGGKDAGRDALKSLQEATGWAQEDFDRVTFFGALPNPRESLFVLSSSKPLDRTRLLKAWAKGTWDLDPARAQALEPTEKRLGGQRFLVRRNEAVFFPNRRPRKKADADAKAGAGGGAAEETSHVVVWGPAKAVEAVLGRATKDVVWETEATRLLALVGEKQPLVAGYLGPELVAQFRRTLGQRDNFLLLTDNTHVGLLAFAEKDGVRVTLEFTYEDAASVERANDFAVKFVKKVPEVLSRAVNGPAGQPRGDAGRRAEELVEVAGAAAKSVTTAREGRRLTMTARFPRDVRWVLRTVNAYTGQGKAK